MDVETDKSANPLLAGEALPDFAAIEAGHIRPAIGSAIERSRAHVETLASVGEPSVDWLRDTELLLERINDVWNPVSHLNSVASNPELREAYNDCLNEITAFYSDLGQNEDLFRRYETLAASLDEGPAAELVRQSLRDFRLAGVALEGEAKKAFRDVSLELAARQAKFEQNVMDATDAFEHHETDNEALVGLPEQVLERAAVAAEEKDLEGWLLKLDPPTYQSVMTLAENQALRQLYYHAWVTRASELGSEDWNNHPVIEDILKLRQRAAELLGFSNYAALSLARKMAQSEDQVLEFLEDLAARTHSFAEQEFERLTEFAGCTLEPWDVAFYSEKLKQQRFSIGDEELRAYFPVPKVLEGLFSLIEKLFAIRLRPVDGQMFWHDTVIRFEIANLDGTPVGSLLTDLYARPNKRGGAWMDSAANRARLGQLERDPVAHLVCNFAPPSANAPSYITHTDVVTLFHEMGHSLHHLLTEIDWPSIAGINGVAWDAVELPSQFLENFAWLPEVLRSISAHRETGEQIPDEKIDTLIASRTFHAGLAMLRQLEFALFDFRLHARPTPAESKEVQELLDAVRREVSVIPAPEFNRFQCSFTHIFAGGYAAGYYSYKWAEVLAADAFAVFAESDSLDTDTAERFRAAILAVGGSRDAMDSFVAFRGREPELDALLRQTGIIE